MKKKIENKIREVLNNTNNKVKEIQSNDNLRNLKFDELDYTEIIVEFEEQFDIMINDLDFDKCLTIDDMVEYLYNLIEKKNN
jgi:acyl carrier protein